MGWKLRFTSEEHKLNGPKYENTVISDDNSTWWLIKITATVMSHLGPHFNETLFTEHISKFNLFWAIYNLQGSNNWRRGKGLELPQKEILINHLLVLVTIIFVKICWLLTCTVTFSSQFVFFSYCGYYNNFIIRQLSDWCQFIIQCQSFGEEGSDSLQQAVTNALLLVPSWSPIASPPK